MRVGFAGAGFMGQVAHLRNYVGLPGCEIVALAERRPKLRGQVAQRYGIPKTYESHEQLAADDEVEAVVAILPHALNDQVACDLLAAGKHVLTEKPMAASLAAGKRMANAAEASGKRLMIGYMKRYDAGVELAKTLIDGFRETGELGETTFVRSHCFGGDWICNIDPPIRTDESYPAWTPTPLPEWVPKDLRTPFDQFNNVYCHNLNLLRYLLDDPLEVESVSLSRPGRVVVFNAGGTTVSLEAGGISRNVWDEETKLYFRDGWVEILTPSPLAHNIPAKVQVYRAGKVQELREPMAPWTWAFRRQAEHFVQCVNEGLEPRSSGRDSLRDLELLEGIFRMHLGM
jgi:predicted dehydrogenase